MCANLFISNTVQLLLHGLLHSRDFENMSPTVYSFTKDVNFVSTFVLSLAISESVENASIITVILNKHKQQCNDKLLINVCKQVHQKFSLLPAVYNRIFSKKIAEISRAVKLTC